VPSQESKRSRNLDVAFVPQRFHPFQAWAHPVLQPHVAQYERLAVHPTVHFHAASPGCLHSVSHQLVKFVNSIFDSVPVSAVPFGVLPSPACVAFLASRVPLPWRVFAPHVALRR
jgi:hypothetical protein